MPKPFRRTYSDIKQELRDNVARNRSEKIANLRLDVPKSAMAQQVLGGMQKALDLPPHLTVKALAGTGKTTTMVEGVNYLRGNKPSIVPSPQQEAIWKQLALTHRDASVGITSFSKATVDDIENRITDIPNCTAMTLHKMGVKAVYRAYNQIEVYDYRVNNIASEITGKTVEDLRFKNGPLLGLLQTLVSLCKANLLGVGILQEFNPDYWENEITKLALHHELELLEKKDELISLVPKVLVRCLDVNKDRMIDCDDMVWLPVVQQLPMQKFDLFITDESQDLNKAQQALALRAGHRIVVCGDPYQSIYGWNGADSSSMTNMFRSLSGSELGCEQLKLTVTRRCSKAVVREAQKYVPEFEAHEDNDEGSVSKLGLAYQVDPNNYSKLVLDGDMVLCRSNAPLVSECLRMTSRGRKSSIKGKKIGEGLLAVLDKISKDSNSLTTTEIMLPLDEWGRVERGKELAKRNPSDTVLATISDKIACIKS